VFWGKLNLGEYFVRDALNVLVSINQLEFVALGASGNEKVGQVNAGWTLSAEKESRFACRVVNRDGSIQSVSIKADDFLGIGLRVIGASDHELEFYPRHHADPGSSSFGADASVDDILTRFLKEVRKDG